MTVLMYIFGTQEAITQAEQKYGVSDAELYLAMRVKQAVDEGRAMVLID